MGEIERTIPKGKIPESDKPLQENAKALLNKLETQKGMKNGENREAYGRSAEDRRNENLFMLRRGKKNFKPES